MTDKMSIQEVKDMLRKDPNRYRPNPIWNHPKFEEALNSAVDGVFELDGVTYTMRPCESNEDYIILVGSNGTVGQIEKRRIR